MAITCKNCNHTFTGHYCNNCGQPADTNKLDTHFLLHDIQHGLFHLDRGIFFSGKELFTRPGHSIREFIEGKRINHFKPISLIVILATIYGILYHTFHINLITNSPDSNVDLAAFNEWTATHFAWITLATIPLYTIGTYICFRKQGYNLIEFLILNTFKAAQRLFAHIATFPLLYYYNNTPHLKTITAIIYSIDVVLIFWTNIQFFNKLSTTRAFLLSVLSHLIFLTMFVLVTAIVLLIAENM
ncbi:MAG: DUF3667 domain-containing protein [Bacteroidota bacterium]